MSTPRECGAYYGTGDGKAEYCRRPEGHRPISEDGVGHSWEPVAGEGQQPDEAPVEALEGAGRDTETPEAAGEAPGGAEPVEPPATARRPHWLPEQVWLGVIVGQWPLRAFSSQEQAERWAAEAKWEAGRQDYEPRRIWAVDIPEDTPTFKVEKIPASTRLAEVQW